MQAGAVSVSGDNMRGGLFEIIFGVPKTKKNWDTEYESTNSYMFSSPLKLKGSNGSLYTVNDLIKSHNILRQQNKELRARVEELEKLCS